MTITYSLELTEITCGKCGGTYAIAESYRKDKAESGGSWHCPYCDVSWGYSEGENAALKRKLAAEKAAHDQTKASRDEWQKLAHEEAGRSERLRRRAKAGVCPCCKRSFAALARHMKTKHPAYGGGG